MKVRHLGQICVGPTLSNGEIKKLGGAIKRDGNVGKMVRLHALLSGETRYKIVRLLSEVGELCVCDLAEVLETTVSAVSHQLRVLRESGVVTTRREGQTIYYSLYDQEVVKFL